MTDRDLERSLLVFAVWSVLGFLALSLYLAGMRADSYLLALVGTGVLLTAFGGHVIINAVFDTGFTPGETALGLAAFGVIVLLFIAATLTDELSRVDFLAGLTLLGTVVIAFVAYLATRHGLRGAFSRFHPKKDPVRGGGRE